MTAEHVIDERAFDDVHDGVLVDVGHAQLVQGVAAELSSQATSGARRKAGRPRWVLLGVV